MSQPVHAGPDDSWHGVVAPGSRFPPEPSRYHLYIGHFCPFAHRAELVRRFKGLESVIDISVVKPYPKGDDKGWPGWGFNGALGPDDVYPGADTDPLFDAKYLHEVYFRADADYKGRYSVPVLWDKKEGTMVNNESAELLRWLPTAFDDVLPRDRPGADLDLYPEAHRSKIDEMSVWMQRDLNSGVYKAGFATDQQSYDQHVPTVFAALNHLEAIIHANGGPFILGKDMTELDIRAYTTVVRFDAIYVQHFKCNLGTIRANYPVIHEWLKNLYWNVTGFRESTDFTHIKENYSKSHDKINPLAITPMGPYPHVEEGVNLDFTAVRPGAVLHPEVVKRGEELYGGDDSHKL
jgi:putative glutathione S-transferase